MKFLLLNEYILDVTKYFTFISSFGVYYSSVEQTSAFLFYRWENEAQGISAVSLRAHSLLAAERGC